MADRSLAVFALQRGRAFLAAAIAASTACTPPSKTSAIDSPLAGLRTWNRLCPKEFSTHLPSIYEDVKIIFL